VNKPKLNIKKLLSTLLWCSIAVCGIVLLVAAVRSKNVQTCKGVEIEISGVNNNFFIDKSDVLSIIKDNVGGKPQGKMISAFNLREIEQSLEQDVWIRNAELFFDNNEILRVDVDEREPVARIFSTDGKSFYIDSSLKILPLSEKFSARLPVFTGFSHRSARLNKADSNLLRQIMDISMVMQADSFLMAMVEQVDITPQSGFEMVPKIGNQLIVFGDAMDVEEKFNKLKLFYKEVISKTGWSKYSIINLQYKNQVVAKIKDAVDKSSDSLRTLQIMQLIAERAASEAADSVQTFMQDTERNSADSSLIQQSMQRDEPQQSSGLTENLNAPASPAVLAPMAPVRITEPPKPAPVKPAAVKISKTTVAKKAVVPAKPVIKKPVTKPVIKPVTKPTTTTTTQPKAVMQKKQ
jgi:cell division protein FtsQ